MISIENMSGEILQRAIDKLFYKFQFTNNPNYLILGENIIYKLLRVTKEPSFMYRYEDGFKFKTVKVIENINDKNCIMICNAIDCSKIILKEEMSEKINIDSKDLYYRQRSK